MRNIIVTGNLPGAAHINKSWDLYHLKLVNFLKSVVVQTGGSQIFGVLHPGQCPAFAEAAIALKDSGYPISLICGVCEQHFNFENSEVFAWNQVLKRVDKIISIPPDIGGQDFRKWALKTAHEDPFSFVIALTADNSEDERSEIGCLKRQNIDVLMVNTKILSESAVAI